MRLLRQHGVWWHRVKRCGARMYVETKLRRFRKEGEKKGHGRPLTGMESPVAHLSVAGAVAVAIAVAARLQEEHRSRRTSPDFYLGNDEIDNGQ